MGIQWCIFVYIVVHWYTFLTVTVSSGHNASVPDTVAPSSPNSTLENHNRILEHHNRAPFLPFFPRFFKLFKKLESAARFSIQLLPDWKSENLKQMLRCLISELSSAKRFPSGKHQRLNNGEMVQHHAANGHQMGSTLWANVKQWTPNMWIFRLIEVTTPQWRATADAGGTPWTPIAATGGHRWTQIGDRSLDTSMGPADTLESMGTHSAVNGTHWGTPGTLWDTSKNMGAFLFSFGNLPLRKSWGVGSDRDIDGCLRFDDFLWLFNGIPWNSFSWSSQLCVSCGNIFENLFQHKAFDSLSFLVC